MTYTYNSKAWQRWRQSVFVRDHFTCQLCGQKGTLNAHHIKRKVDNPRLVYRRDNGIALCEKCHNVVTGYEAYFEKLFSPMVKKKLTLEHVYKFFAKMTEQIPELVSQFKRHDRWLKIPEYLVGKLIKYENRKQNG